MSADRIDELLERAAEVDEGVGRLHREPITKLEYAPHGSYSAIDWDATRHAIAAGRMKAAGYRAEALVLQLRGPGQCESIGPNSRLRCQWEKGHDGKHGVYFEDGRRRTWEDEPE
jgi:hypothetical protein